MLFIHINSGHDVLAGPFQPSLFVSRCGNPFNDSTFVHFWDVHVLRRAPFPYFPPSMARRMFVQEYTGTFGMDPSMWDGAATVCFCF